MAFSFRIFIPIPKLGALSCVALPLLCTKYAFSPIPLEARVMAAKLMRERLHLPGWQT